MLVLFYLIWSSSISKACGGAEGAVRGSSGGPTALLLTSLCHASHALCLAARLTEYQQRPETVLPTTWTQRRAKGTPFVSQSMVQRRPLPSGEALSLAATPLLCCGNCSQHPLARRGERLTQLKLHYYSFDSARSRCTHGEISPLIKFFSISDTSQMTLLQF